MKQIIVLAAVFLALFAASAGGTWYYIQKQQEQEKAKQELAEKSLELKPAEDLPAVDGKHVHTPELPLPFREQDVTAESLLRMAEALRKREEAVREQEQRLKQEQARLQFILQDMDQERMELNAIHDKIVAKITEAEKLLGSIKVGQEELNELKQQMPEKITDTKPRSTSPDESASISKLVELYQTMESETAARYMREICDSGKISLAAKVLNRMEKQAATDILVAMDDPVLVNQIVQEMLSNPVAVAEANGVRRKR